MDIGTSAEQVALSRGMMRRIVFSSSIGNALEWFDFLVYGYFAPIIAKVFFPVHDEWLLTLLAVGTFGISFLMRPLGAIVLGIYGDRHGRKAALTLAIALMMAGTLAMAVMPPYASIGIAAPLLILLARLVQGFAVGGEFGSATALMVEHSPNRRGYFASWQFASQGAAAILAAAFGSLLAWWLPPEQLQAWGWRLPFCFGLVLGPVGWYIRSHLDETPEFLANHGLNPCRPRRKARRRGSAVNGAACCWRSASSRNRRSACTSCSSTCRCTRSSSSTWRRRARSAWSCSTAACSSCSRR